MATESQITVEIPRDMLKKRVEAVVEKMAEPKALPALFDNLVLVKRPKIVVIDETALHARIERAMATVGLQAKPASDVLTDSEVVTLLTPLCTTKGWSGSWTFPQGYLGLVKDYGYVAHFLKFRGTKTEPEIREFYLCRRIIAEHHRFPQKATCWAIRDTLNDDERKKDKMLAEQQGIYTDELIEEVRDAWDNYVVFGNAAATVVFHASLPEPRCSWQQAEPQNALPGGDATNPHNHNAQTDNHMNDTTQQQFNNCTIIGRMNNVNDSGRYAEGDYHEHAAPAPTAEAPAGTTADTTQKGRPTEHLFTLKDNPQQPDEATASREADRLISLLNGLDLDFTLNVSARLTANRLITALVREWQRRGMVSRQLPARALVRFLIDDCGISFKCKDPMATYGRNLTTWLGRTEDEEDKKLLLKVKETFA